MGLKYGRFQSEKWWGRTSTRFLILANVASTQVVPDAGIITALTRAMHTSYRKFKKHQSPYLSLSENRISLV